MPTKILVLIGSLDSGGCERHLLTTLPLLKRRGHDICVMTLSRPGSLAPNFRQEGIQVISPWMKAPASQSIILRAIRLLAISLQYLWILTVNKPTIVHMYLPASYWIGGPLTLLFSRSKCIMSRRSLNTYQFSSAFIRKIESTLHRRMHFNLGNSIAVSQQLISEGSPKERTGLIYNGVKNARHTIDETRLRQELDISNDKVIMVVVANLIPYKGHIDLIYAASQLHEKGITNWVLLVVGRDDGIGNQLFELSRQENLEQNIRFLGSRDDVPSILTSSDIGILVSHQEGFSNSILEYMAAGLPIIATDVGGNAEAVEDDHSGIIVPPKSPSSIALAMERLIKSPELRIKMGSSARNAAELKFSIEKMISDYTYMYDCISNDLIPEKLCIK